MKPFRQPFSVVIVKGAMQKVVLFWFRRDLRLEDNAGLDAALSSGFPVVPVFIFDTTILQHLEDKDDRRVSFIYAALEDLQDKLISVESSLDVRYGKPIDTIKALLQDYTVQAVYTNHDYEPDAVKRDEEISRMLQAIGVHFHAFKDQVIFEKDEVVNDDGSGYMVYTPYAKKWKRRLQETGLSSYPSQKKMAHFFRQKRRAFPSLEAMGFVLNPDIPALEKANKSIMSQYHQTRDIPSQKGTTRMGIHLRFGTISVRQLVAQAMELNEVYLGELIWREFFMQVLWHHPRVVTEACKKEYDAIRWRNNEAEFERWCRGETGFPIVDAGMQELNATGFMHNRVRMIVGSFLVKDLLIDWRWGEAYFARRLLDYELSSNNGNWQWVAGCGCDAAPYFRVFSPEAQAKRFDPEGTYIRKWVPEFETKDYPRPIVDHAAARERCIKVYKAALATKQLSQ